MDKFMNSLNAYSDAILDIKLDLLRLKAEIQRQKLQEALAEITRLKAEVSRK